MVDVASKDRAGIDAIGGSWWRGPVSRMRANAAQVRLIVEGRSRRLSQERSPLPPGHRPQDMVAILLLTVGIAVIVLDIPAYPWIQSLPPEYRTTFGAFTDVGKAHWILWSTGLFCIFTLAADWDRFVPRIRMALTAAWVYCAFVFTTVAASGLAVLVLKWILGRARPKLYEQVGPVEFDFLAFKGAYTSFPSGHSTTVATLAAALALIFPSWRWLIIVTAFWISFSRIMVGAHYPSDVIAGTLLGITVTLTVARWMARRRIGFMMTEAGRLVPDMGAFSARLCARAVWRGAIGRRPFYRPRTVPGVDNRIGPDT